MIVITSSTPLCVNTYLVHLYVKPGRDFYCVKNDFTDTVPDAAQAATAEEADDTAELPILALQATRDIHKYAKGFLRFYRARRILSGNRNINTVTRERALYAWQYLVSLAPKDLPPTLRQPFREIFALADQLGRGDETQSPVKFVAQILRISTSIDQMVDDLLTDTEKPSN